MQATYSQEQIIKTREIVKIIGDVSNILILYELINFGEKSFNELKRMTGINSVTLSKKLTLLKKEGLVANHKLGIENRYNITEKSNSFLPLIKDIENMAIDK